MKERDRLKAHLLLDITLRNDPQLLHELLDNPRSIFERLGVTEDAFRCTEEVHEAYSRGVRIAEEAEALTDAKLTEALPRIAELARQKFGDHFQVDKVPFGLRFREKVSDANRMDWTATATFECTFGPGCHADVDG